MPTPINNGGSCEHIIINSWPGGFQGSIRITNNTSAMINDWTVSWSYNDGTVVVFSWNAELSGDGSYTARNLVWNGTIAPSQSIEIGFIGQGDGNASVVTGNVCGN
jgi:hypothetical protein